MNEQQVVPMVVQVGIVLMAKNFSATQMLDNKRDLSRSVENHDDDTKVIQVSYYQMNLRDFLMDVVQ